MHGPQKVVDLHSYFSMSKTCENITQELAQNPFGHSLMWFTSINEQWVSTALASR